MTINQEVAALEARIVKLEQQIAQFLSKLVHPGQAGSAGSGGSTNPPKKT